MNNEAFDRAVKALSDKAYDVYERERLVRTVLDAIGEPTPAMLQAGEFASFDERDGIDKAGAVWRAMHREVLA